MPAIPKTHRLKSQEVPKNKSSYPHRLHLNDSPAYFLPLPTSSHLLPTDEQDKTPPATSAYSQSSYTSSETPSRSAECVPDTDPKDTPPTSPSPSPSSTSPSPFRCLFAWFLTWLWRRRLSRWLGRRRRWWGV